MLTFEVCNIFTIESYLNMKLGSVERVIISYKNMVYIECPARISQVLNGPLLS